MDNPTTGNTGFSGYPKKAKKKDFSLIQMSTPTRPGSGDHRMIRVAANPAARRTTNGRAPAFVGEAAGCCAPGVD